MNADDRDYYLKRISDEDQAARDAVSLAARWRHEELASLYRMRVLAFDRSVAEDDLASSLQPFVLVPVPPETAAA
jgi:hypothetical protein